MQRFQENLPADQQHDRNAVKILPQLHENSTTVGNPGDRNTGRDKSANASANASPSHFTVANRGIEHLHKLEK